MRAYFNGESLSFGGSGSGGDSIPQGVIVIWSGSADNIPDSWHLCDGTNGTPDLRGRFVVGAGSTYKVGAIGGEAEHALIVNELPPHSHPQMAYAGSGSLTAIARVSGLGTTQVGGGINTGSIGSSQPHNNLPPYYALCYIMKL